MKATITREQAIQIMGSKRTFDRHLYDSFDGVAFIGELARLRTGAKLFSVGSRFCPTFEIRSGVCDSDGEDIQEIIEALERGKSGLLSGSRMGC